MNQVDKNSKQYRLENQIYKVIHETGREPRVIIMHPKTWFDLMEEVIGKNDISINRHVSDMRYKGIKVIRSLDLSENDFLTLTNLRRYTC